MRLIDGDALIANKFKNDISYKAFVNLVKRQSTIEPKSLNEPSKKAQNAPNDDFISRKAAIEHLKKRLYETALNNDTEHPYYEEMADNRVDIWMNEVPSAQPEIIRCKDCKYSDTDNTLGVMFCWRVSYHEASEDGFCSWAERRTDEAD